MPSVKATREAEPVRGRRRESRDQNLQRIRDAAISEFSLHGLRGATTDSIAQRAGMTRPQLHYYIAGKEELYEELLGSVVAQWAEDKFDLASDDPEAVLRKYIADKVRRSSEQPELARMLGLEMLSGAPNMGKYWPEAVQVTKATVKTIDRWVREGRIRKVNGHLLLMNIWAMSSHYAYFAAHVQVLKEASPRVRMDAEEITREITNLILGGCGFSPT